MQHRDNIVDQVADAISKDANLIIEIFGPEFIRETVDEFDDKALEEYFTRGYTGWASVEEYIEEINAVEAAEYRQQNTLGGWCDEV